MIKLSDVDITEEQIRSTFSRFKEFVSCRKIPECKQFIEKVIVYKDYVEVAFNMVFCFVDNKIEHNLNISYDIFKINQ